MEYLKIFTDYPKKLRSLSDSERGRLFVALLEYARTGEPQKLRGNEQVAFDFACVDIDIQRQKYDELCAKNKSNRNSTTRDQPSPLVTTRDHSSEDKIKDEIKEKEFITSSGEDVCPTGVGRGDIKTIIEAWNSLNLNPIRDIKPNTTRRQLLNGRLSNYSLSDVLQAIENVRCSEFLNGQNKNGWTATFDWFVKPTNFQKVLDGNYDNRRSPAATSTADRLSQMIEDGVFND